MEKMTLDELYEALEKARGSIEDALFDEAFFSWSKQDIARNQRKLKSAKETYNTIESEIKRRLEKGDTTWNTQQHSVE